MQVRPVLAAMGLAAAVAAACAPARADEGMWLPSQLPSIAAQLKAAGYRGDPAALADLSKAPMNAVVSLGGCTASFVSPEGLVVTNHHCAMGAIQLNSTPQDNLIENGFYNEFLLAMTNLQANNLAGGSRAGSFAYFGPGTGTSPLPIYLSYINGRTDATNTGSYTGGSWTNTALTNDMARFNPSPANSATDLDGDATRRANAIAAGYPANFFVVNPAVANVNVTDSGASTDVCAGG